MSYTPNPVPQDVEQIPAFLSMELMKLADSPVKRGSSKFYTTGSAWDDTTANNAVLAIYPAGKVTNDEVTISNGTNFAMTKYWNGSAWIAPGTVIDGSLLVSGTVSAAKINANGLTIKDPSGNIILDAGSSSNNIDFSKIFGSTKPENNATVGANGSNLSISNSGNMLPNSDFATNPLTNNTWVVSWNAGGGTNYTVGGDIAAPYWAPAGGHTLGVYRGGTTLAASSWFDIMYDKYIPMQAGITFELSGYLAAHRCGVYLNIAYYNSSYAYISETGWGTTTPPSGGNDLNNWYRAGGIATTPANTEYVRIFVRGSSVDAGQSDPYFWATKLFFGLTKSGQTQLSPWSAATSSGAFAELNQITGSNSVTYIANAAIKNALIENISADKITTGTLSASTNLTVGTAARSGSTMTGAGAVFEGTGGYFSLGNSTKNITFDGTAFYLNGPMVLSDNIANNVIIPEIVSNAIPTDVAITTTHTATITSSTGGAIVTGQCLSINYIGNIKRVASQTVKGTLYADIALYINGSSTPITTTGQYLETIHSTTDYTTINLSDFYTDLTVILPITSYVVKVRLSYSTNSKIVVNKQRIEATLSKK